MIGRQKESDREGKIVRCKRERERNIGIGQRFTQKESEKRERKIGREGREEKE